MRSVNDIFYKFPIQNCLKHGPFLSPGENIHTTKKTTEVTFHASTKFGLKVNAVKIKHIFLTRHQTAGRSHM
jgi:hypothetical protein